MTLDDISVGKYVASIYDHKWYVGTVSNLSDENNDVLVNFMHPHGPARSFMWPTFEDKCWVPLEHILCMIDCPQTTSGGRQYFFNDKCINTVIKHLIKHLNLSSFIYY